MVSQYVAHKHHVHSNDAHNGKPFWVLGGLCGIFITNNKLTQAEFRQLSICQQI